MNQTREVKHTALPWELSNRNISSFEADGVSDVAYMNECLDWKANAEFIVRAVNSHYELLEALKVCRAYIHDTTPSGISRGIVTNLINEAIAKAEGGDK